MREVIDIVYPPPMPVCASRIRDHSPHSPRQPSNTFNTYIKYIIRSFRLSGYVHIPIKSLLLWAMALPALRTSLAALGPKLDQVVVELREGGEAPQRLTDKERARLKNAVSHARARLAAEKKKEEPDADRVGPLQTALDSSIRDRDAGSDSHRAWKRTAEGVAWEAGRRQPRPKRARATPDDAVLLEDLEARAVNAEAEAAELRDELRDVNGEFEAYKKAAETTESSLRAVIDTLEDGLREFRRAL